MNPTGTLTIECRNIAGRKPWLVIETAGRRMTILSDHTSKRAAQVAVRKVAR